MTRKDLIVEFITVGREILDGRVIDTNSVVMAELLRPLGLIPRFAQRVDDSLERVVSAFAIAESRSDVILVTGGLGPTSDDLTAQAFAQFLREPLVLREDALAEVKNFFNRFQIPVTKVQEKQAWLPETAALLKNHEGSAPGFFVSRGDKKWFFLPGVPREMKRMLSEGVLPELPRKTNYRSMTWATQFTSEGKLQERLQSVEDKLPEGFEVTYRTRFPENHVALYGDCSTAALAKNFETLASEIAAALERSYFTSASNQEHLKNLEEVVFDLALEKNAVLATVESCTGGQIGARLTEIPGSSKAYWGSLIVYDNTAKLALAEIEPAILEKHGAVSDETAKALCSQGLLKMERALSSSSSPKKLLCVSTTGIAGPTGGTETKPVGLCYVGLATLDRETGARTVIAEEIRGRAGLDRQRLRQFFSQKALDLVRKALS